MFSLFATFLAILFVVSYLLKKYAYLLSFLGKNAFAPSLSPLRATPPHPICVVIVPVGLDHVDEVGEGLLLHHGDRLEVP